jgi:Fucose-binding lectin II (PA-IIL)
MPNIATVYLPLSTWVHIRAVTNAAQTQRVTIAVEGSNPVVLTGSGEHDSLMQNGDFGITTPSTSKSPLGCRVTVAVESQTSTGWQPSMVSQGSSSIMYYNLSLVVSEDSVDNDWNDAVVMFSWWIPPSSRTVEDLHRDQAV